MSSPALSPDLFLARRAVLGHADAWEELVTRYGRRIYNLALRFATSREEAEDLTQEVFVRLYENLERYRGEVPLIGWTLRLSRNLCIDHYRRKRRERVSIHLGDEMLESLPGADDPGRSSERREQIRLVERVLQEMPEEMATAVMLRDLHDWSYEEMSCFLDAPLGTVKSRLNRGRQELARRVGRLLENAEGGGEDDSLSGQKVTPW